MKTRRMNLRSLICKGMKKLRVQLVVNRILALELMGRIRNIICSA
jgi:hypothetical protein